MREEVRTVNRLVRLSQGKFVHCLLRRVATAVASVNLPIHYGMVCLTSFSGSLRSPHYCNPPTNPILGVPFFINCDFVMCVNGGAFRKRAAPIERRRTFDGGRNLGSSCGRLGLLSPPIYAGMVEVVDMACSCSTRARALRRSPQNICVIWFRSPIPTRDLLIYLSYPISISTVRQSNILCHDF